MPRTCRLLAGAGAFVVACCLGAAADLPAILSPQPEVIAFARTNRIPLAGIAPAAETSEAAAGDFVVVLITLRAGRETKQWLTRFEVSPLTEKERVAAAKSAGEPMTITLAESHPYEFKTTPDLALDILAAGPFVVGEKPPAKAKHSRAVISSELLSLGLDEGCRLIASKMAADPAEKLTAASLSPPEERTLAGIFPALIAFVQGVQSTPGLSEILWEVMEKPSVWSLIKNRGQIGLGVNIGDDITVIEAGAWPGAERTLFGMGIALSIYDQPALRLLLVVTAPRPPLVTTAGIIGILGRPPGKADKRMDLQLIAAGRAPTAAH